MSTAPTYGVATREQIAGLTGRETLQAMLDGKLPGAPMAERVHMQLIEIGDGLAIFEGHPAADLLNPLGTVHGGFALTLIDSAAGCALHTTLPAGVGYTSVETKANFIRAIRPATGPVRAEGRVVTAGRTIAVSEVRMTDREGRVIAHGTSTLMILRER